MESFLHLSLPVRDLEASRTFYVDLLGCEPGCVREELGCIDVWFYGLQLTLQRLPDQVLMPELQAGRHFGVALPPNELEALLERLVDAPVEWVEPLSTDTTGILSGKTSAKMLDPSGNVIEFKSYAGGRADLDAG